MVSPNLIGGSLIAPVTINAALQYAAHGFIKDPTTKSVIIAKKTLYYSARASLPIHALCWYKAKKNNNNLYWLIDVIPLVPTVVCAYYVIKEIKNYSPPPVSVWMANSDTSPPVVEVPQAI